MAKKKRFNIPSRSTEALSETSTDTSQDLDLESADPDSEITAEETGSELVENQDVGDSVIAGHELFAEVDEEEEDPIDEDEDEIVLEGVAQLTHGEDEVESEEVEGNLEDEEAELDKDEELTDEILSEDSLEPVAVVKRNFLPFARKNAKILGDINLNIEPAITDEVPRRAPAEIKKEINRLADAQAALERKYSVLSTNFSEAERAMQEFVEFVTKVENSIAWRLKSKLEKNLESVDADIKRIMEVSSEIDVSDVGYLVKLRRLFLRRFWMATLFAFLATIIFVVLQRILQDSENFVALIIVEYPLESFIATVVSLWMSSNFTFMFWYYRTWSNYERSLRQSEIMLLWVRDSLKQAQESKSKLTKLYAHTEQWVGLIALSLHHPWQTDPKWEQASGSILSDEKLPNAVSVAQAVEGSAGAMAALERSAVARLLRPGWREQIFMRQIAAVAKHQGIPQDKYNIETFDKDSPTITNGSRNFFVNNFRDPLVQLAVARSYLSELSIEVQTVGLLESKPPVKNDYVDELSAISEDLDMLGEVEVDQAWDGFLLDIVGNERDPIIPMSPFSFTDRAVIENAHGLPSVHIQMPMRLRSLTESLESNRVLISAYEDSARLPLDLVVRVDFVGPLEPDMLRLWSKSVTSSVAARPNANQGEARVSASCSNCGRRECPAAAPGTDIACTYSGV